MVSDDIVCISVNRIGSLYIWKDTFNAENYIQVFETVETMSLFEGLVCFSKRTLDNILHLQQHGFVVEESVS